MITLYTNGCSHSAGSEIDSPLSPINYEKAFPGVISKLLNMNYINESAPGGGNDRIIRMTVDFVENWKLEHSSSELFVLISWSGPDRLEIVKNQTQHNMCPGLQTSHWWKTFSPDIRKYYELHLRFNSDLCRLTNKLLTDMILLQGYLLSNNIKFLFVNSFWKFDYNNLNLPGKNLFNALDSQYCIYKTCNEGNYCDFLDENNYKKTENYHFFEDGHMFYAQSLIRYINEIIS